MNVYKKVISAKPFADGLRWSCVLECGHVEVRARPEAEHAEVEPKRLRCSQCLRVRRRSTFKASKG